MAEIKKTNDKSLSTFRSYIKQAYPEINLIYGLDMAREPTKNLIEASIDRMKWQVRLRLDPQFEEKIDSLVKMAHINVDDPLKKLLDGVAEHEMGHWSRCPKDIVLAEMILSSISAGLKQAGFNEVRIVEATPYVANMFCDIVENVLVRDNAFREGRGIKYTAAAYTSSDKLSNPEFPDFYALFVDCQLKCAKPDEIFRDVGEKYAKGYSKLAEPSKKLLAAFVGGELADKAFSDRLTDDDIKKVKDTLSNESTWAGSARNFARIIAPFVKDEQKNMEQNISLMPMLDRFKNDEEFRKHMLQQGVKREHQGGAGGAEGLLERGNKAGNSMAYTKNTEVFDEIYRQVGGKIVLDFIGSRDEEKRPSYDLFYMSKEPVEQNHQMPKKMAWDRTIYLKNENGYNVNVFAKTSPFVLPFEANSIKGGSSGDLLWILDTSGSMGWSIKPLDDSKYDICIRSVYSVINYLESNNRASGMNFGLAQFGVRDMTTWSGWKNYSQLGLLRNQVFTGYQNAGETVLDPKTIDSILSKKNNFLAMMVSDGVLSNEEEGIASCKKIIKEGNSLVLFELQNRSRLGVEVKEAGGIVIAVDKAEDLVGINLQIVASKWKKIIR